MSGIKHIEFWVSDLDKSLLFYKTLFNIIGWEQYETNGFRCGMTKIYFLEKEVLFNENIGPRHICFEADSIEILTRILELLKLNNLQIIRGPIEYTHKGNTAHTIDFKDRDGYIIEVATRSHK